MTARSYLLAALYAALALPVLWFVLTGYLLLPVAAVGMVGP